MNLYFTYFFFYNLATALNTPKFLIFIKNNDLRSCRECKHFIEDKTDYPYDQLPDNNYGRCKLFGTKNIVTGRINNEYASAARKDKNLCGMDAKQYEKVDEDELDCRKT